MILIKDNRSVLVDTGFGSDVTNMEDVICESGVSPDWHDNRLVASATFKAPQADWSDRNIKPKNWKKL